MTRASPEAARGGTIGLVIRLVIIIENRISTNRKNIILAVFSEIELRLFVVQDDGITVSKTCVEASCSYISLYQEAFATIWALATPCEG